MGEVFAGRYELVDPIGRGGVGAVWRAWDHRRRRYVAAKVLQQSDAHSLLRFVREQALRIDHPHVLAPASWAADDDKVLFTMDLVAGGSLVHLIGDYGPLPPAFVCTLLDQLLSGLAAVHAEGVVHRDIKPANVLLEATGTARPRLRLSDFGIAMRLGEARLTETNLVVGTPGYLAPEQMMGAEPDFPADLFAVGLVALYLLEGAKPDAKALVQYFAEHGTPGAPKSIPEALWQVVAMLLQPDPQARFRTATGARKALAAAAELLPEPGPDDDLIEIFDQIGPLPSEFAPEGPLKRASGVDTGSTTSSVPSAGSPEPENTPGLGAESNGRDSAWPGTDSVPVDPRQGIVSRPTPAPTRTPAPPTSPPTSPPPLPSPMSDTGSFHLPPPQGQQPQQGGQYQPSYSSPHEFTHVLSSPQPRADPSTASYTAQAPQVPPSAPPVPQHRGRRARRRPGPPAKVVIPVLLLALACYAVGFWALAHV
ncbi:serine/threonine-protein kinase [Streptomyces prunicolor]|uniref:non-specific serine/threonine protein kinase n=1 Tax=Streptomyces prunicolor TaxID=67348 RepID=A0ABU4FQR6_9ACTN|nr:serine/threonine-protein kinase [Streptomyces prunicolor]MCX5235747.1 serine/threonine protein kinase [Streptomyces prunicolor]MDV7222956.1 serine/threonine-protein kinase [Streptomyces prunicolor]